MPETLFARSTDAELRRKTGAHFTSRADILLIVEPVLMQPLRREWQATKDAIAALKPAALSGDADARQSVADHYFGFLRRLSTVRVLDPAAGAGNFLWVALRCLLELEREVHRYAEEWDQ